ncbi:5-bromo-4-chloroindolyl phosphate hydrolysis family protein [Vagococcus fluvialis]|jgi:5-bromo-4-chloroindolyl phosphate hydrolysis protein|uniref:5-bromo-4-chloroindolyl phosphate hydrolysis family protein n=1 Tax=Vagococcus fluvialis TaxID=2738 RepID=UPI001A8CAE5A|nr:5-bromo-4-chloroindolyl phosphate hydrolysis family protein [Vagococcus fluvialis]MBO0429373.1 5-bromo-4-chloroindolyl phosphate hydrolysis family protein [Vagococcus fluvialis]
MKKTNNSKLYRLLGVIVILIPLIFIFNQSSFINTLLSAALFFAIFFAVLRLIKLIFGKNKNQDIDKMPELTKEKEAHYSEFGMNDKEIVFFRETMADAKKQITTLDNNMQEVAKLKAINLRYDTLKASRAMFKEIVKEPNKLHQADRFLYNHLPNVVELTSKYIEINNHELKTKDTFDALNQCAAAIEEVSQLIVKDYADFVKDDLDDLDVEISIAQQNVDREKEMEEYKHEKENI